MNGAVLLNPMHYFYPVLVGISFVDHVPNCLESIDGVLRFDGPDVVVCASDISEKCRDKRGRPPPNIKRAVGELPIASSLGGFLLLDSNCDPATYIEALL